MKGYAGKVLMLVENPFPGDTRVKNEAVTLVRAGYKVTVVSLRLTRKKRSKYVHGVRVYRIPKRTFFKKKSRKRRSVRDGFLRHLISALGYLFEYFYFTGACFFLSFYILIREGFDVVHVHNPPDMLFLVGAFYRLLGKKFVFDHHDLSPELYLSRFGVKDGFIHTALLKIEKLCLRSANMVIATNESYKRIDRERSAVKPENIYVVRNGPDMERLKLTSPDEKLREMNKTILGYVGEINPQDGLDYLLRAIKYLVYDLGRKDVYCVIIGSGDALNDLKVLALELEIDNYVWFTGFVYDPDLVRYLSTADICVDPDPSSPLNDVSTWIKIMEYMALGKPIVSFDLAETRVSAGKAALYVPPNDEKEFARAIAKLMDNSELRAKMGEYGYQRVRNKLAWQHVSKNLILAYEALSGQGRDGASTLDTMTRNGHTSSSSRLTPETEVKQNNHG